MKRTSRRVLVTGAGGFLGGALCRRLLSQGDEVHGSWRQRPPPPGVMAWRRDLRLEEDVEALFEESTPDLVFHLASTVNPDRDPAALAQRLDDVTLPTDRVARACLRRGLRLVAAGTCEEYGDGQAPFSEAQAPQPVSPYSAAKAAAGQWVMSLSRGAGLRATWVRPFLSYGSGQREGALVAAAMRAAAAREPLPMTDGAQTRELLHVDDMARALELSAKDEAIGRVLNLCGGEELSVYEIARRVFERAGAPLSLLQRGALPRRPGEVNRFCGDPTLCREVLGFFPEISLDEGLDRTRNEPAALPPLTERLWVRPVRAREDARGALRKLHPGSVAGEVYSVVALPGQRRGDHLHPRMAERFLGLSGAPLLGVYDPNTRETHWMKLLNQSVEVPAGLAHVILAGGDAPCEVLALAERPHDPADVLPCPVPGEVG